MHNKDSENNEPEQIKEYINCFNFAYIQRLALATNGKVGLIEFVLCEMVRGLSSKSGKCIAKNDFFAERLCLSEVQTSRIIKILCGLGLLENQRKKYGWERMVTEKYYQIVKHEKKHLSLREYEKAGLKITVPTELSQPEKKERAAKTAKTASPKIDEPRAELLKIGLSEDDISELLSHKVRSFEAAKSVFIGAFRAGRVQPTNENLDLFTRCIKQLRPIL